MGYTTDFTGSIAISPPLNAEEIAFLKKFNHTRRMDRELGPYFVDGTEEFGQGKDRDIRDYNRPPQGQPGLWCQWTPTDDGTAIEWDGGEKFYESVAWMEYLIEHFLKPGAIAAEKLPFLQANHILNGTITAQGEDISDRWVLEVADNEVDRIDEAATAAPLSPAELATVLAALRYYQNSEMTDPERRTPDIDDIATNGGTLDALDSDAIDTLCEELNR